MKTKFNSQICTTREQSERLLTLGLKKETADMCIRWGQASCEMPRKFTKRNENEVFPAWSLHRLWELGSFAGITLSAKEKIAKLYDLAIDNFEELIKEGYFNKEYLV